MITKSNNTSIFDVAELLGEVNRPAMVAALLHNPVKKDWAYNTLEDIKAVQKKGYEIWGQVSCRPLTMEFTMQEPYMLEGLTSWKEYMLQNSYENKMNVLTNNSFRKKVLEEIEDTTKNKLFIGNWEKIILVKTKNLDLKHFEGYNIRDISLKYNKHPLDWLLDNTISGGIDDLFSAELLNSDNNEVKKLLTHNNSTIALSDAGAHLSLLCDAGYGLELLGKWTRDLKIFSLEEAVNKLTAKQADICRIPKRGRLVPGHYADMILFDPNIVGTSKTYRVNDLPASSERLTVDAIGLKEVWVNGKNINSYKTGRVLRSFLV